MTNEEEEAQLMPLMTEFVKHSTKAGKEGHLGLYGLLNQLHRACLSGSSLKEVRQAHV